MSRLDDFETWKRETRNAIFAASIALQARDRIAQGRPLTPEDMKRISEEAAAISELWEETQP